MQQPFSMPNATVSPPPMNIPPNSFGLIVPGGPVRTDFAPVDASGMKFALTLTCPGDLPSPLTSIAELVVMLTSTQSLPASNQYGVLFYWQLSFQQEQSGFELLGSLTLERPSHIIRTGWSEHEQFLALPVNHGAGGPPVTLSIGLSIEPLDTIRNLAGGTTPTASTRNAQPSMMMHPNSPQPTTPQHRPVMAEKIAKDLYNYMQSFDTGGTGTSGSMVVPKNIFDRWWKRFQAKSQRDPHFFLKNTVE